MSKLNNLKRTKSNLFRAPSLTFRERANDWLKSKWAAFSIGGFLIAVATAFGIVKFVFGVETGPELVSLFLPITSTATPTNTPSPTVTLTSTPDIQTTQTQQALQTITSITQTYQASRNCVFDGDKHNQFTSDFKRWDMRTEHRCAMDIADGNMVVRLDDVPAWQDCAVNLQDRKIVPEAGNPALGFVEAVLSYKGLPEQVTKLPAAEKKHEVSLYIEMVTYVEQVGLNIRCGLMDRNGEIRAYFSVATIAPPERLTCSDTIADKDNTDGRCDIEFGEFGPNIQANHDYKIHLEANPNSVGVFSCTIDSGNGQSNTYPNYFISTEDTNFKISSFSGLGFQRLIRASAIGNSPALFTVNDVCESN